MSKALWVGADATKRLSALAGKHVAHAAMSETRTLAALQAEAQLASWIMSNIDQLLDAAGGALQPALDDFVDKALALPAEVAHDERFAVPMVRVHRPSGLRSQPAERD